MTYEEHLNKVQEFIQFQFFLKIFNIVSTSGVCPDTTAQEWLKTLSYMHTKGWLFYGQEQGKIVTILGAYRIKEFDESKTDTMPIEEEGDILYIPFVVSYAKDKMILKKMLNDYAKLYPNIKEVIFYERNSDDKIKRFKIGEYNGKEEESRVTATTDVSS